MQERFVSKTTLTRKMVIMETEDATRGLLCHAASGLTVGSVSSSESFSTSCMRGVYPVDFGIYPHELVSSFKDTILTVETDH